MNRIIGLALFALSFATATSTNIARAAFWDWDEDEVQERLWAGYNLSWAADIAPQHPSWTWLQANISPPPRELWCRFNTVPTQADCNEHFARTQDWVDDYLGEHVPLAELDYNPECASSCYP